MGMTEEEKVLLLRREAALRERRFHKVRAVALHKWPIWARGLKLAAAQQDKGIGDVVARLIGDERSQAFKAWCKNTFGKECGCSGRQHRWNRMYPL